MSVEIVNNSFELMIDNSHAWVEESIMETLD